MTDPQPVGFLHPAVRRTIVVWGATLLITSAMLAPHASAQSPNIVVILADDCTFRDLGCYGGQAHTPHIDRLAAEGLRFRRCFQAAPMCSPTRHNLYTGIYPVKSGAYPNHTFVAPGTSSIVHYLQPHGYRVALSGKTHIGPKTVFPFEYSAKKNNPDMQKIETLFAECREASTPFCLFACSNEPHTPWNKGDASRYPPEDIQLPPYLVDTPVVREAFSRYLAEITYYDSQVGQILELLDQYQLRDNTLVMVLSEQGNSLPFAKWTCYGSGLQSAMIVRWPGEVTPARTTEALVEYTDVTPTLVEVAGGDPDASLEGRSFLGVLRGQTEQHKQFTYGVMTTRGIINGNDSYPIRSICDGKHRLIWNLRHEAVFQNACTQSDEFQSMIKAAEGGDANAQRLVEKYLRRPEFELYDCHSDPLDMHNLAGQSEHAETLHRLHDQLQQWMRSQGDEGLQTEREALLHSRRFKGMTLEQAEAVWHKHGI